MRTCAFKAPFFLAGPHFYSPLCQTSRMEEPASRVPRSQGQEQEDEVSSTEVFSACLSKPGDVQASAGKQKQTQAFQGLLQTYAAFARHGNK